MKISLGFLLIALMLISNISYPVSVANKPVTVHSCIAKRSAHNSVPCSHHNTQRKTCPVCNFCPLCLVFEVPAKSGIQQNIALVSIDYPQLLPGKLTGYNPSCWRPPNA